MKILLAGTLSPLQWAVAERLSAEGHRVSLLGKGHPPENMQKKLPQHNVSLTHPSAEQVFAAGRFEGVLFFLAYQSIPLDGQHYLQEGLVDGLYRIQTYAEKSGVAHFFLLSDARVFGMDQVGLEHEQPAPDTPVGRMLLAAEDSFRYAQGGAMCRILLRVTNLYAPGVEEGFFAQVKRAMREGVTVRLPGDSDAAADFLHIADLTLFLTLAVEGQSSGVMHLQYSDELRNHDVAEWLHAYLPASTITYDDAPARRHLLRGERAFRRLRWVPRHLWADDLQEMLEGGNVSKRHAKRARSAKMERWQRLLRKSSPWLQLAGLGLLSAFLSQLVQRYALFRFVDFWLFFVILMGTLHGMMMGMAAAGIASLFYIIDWLAADNGAYLLIINVDNWLPFVMYFLCGGLFGYIHDNHRYRAEAAEKESAQMQERVGFLESGYRQALEDRDLLLEQVIRSRDSFGRIYAITQALEGLQPVEVFYSTLSILEDLQQSQSVALYTCRDSSRFARLMLCSRTLEGKLERSLRLYEMPKLQQAMHAGEIFENKALDKAHPDIAAPVLWNGALVAVIALWDVPLEQRTLYHTNLLRVVTGLVQSSLVRAIQYADSQAELYLENTQFLRDDAFRTLLSTHQKMAEQGVSTHLLFRLNATESPLSMEQVYARLTGALRGTDVCGMMQDGAVYVLLPQARMEDLTELLERFFSAGLLFDVLPGGRISAHSMAT